MYAHVISRPVYEHTYQTIGNTETLLENSLYSFPWGRWCRWYMYYHDKGRIFGRVQLKCSMPPCHTGNTNTDRWVVSNWPCWYDISDSFRPRVPIFPSRLPKGDELPHNSSCHHVAPILPGRESKVWHLQWGEGTKGPMGVWSKQCLHLSLKGSIIWENHSFFAWCSSWYGMLSRSTYPYISHGWQGGACVWHGGFLWYNHTKYLQITPRQNRESSIWHYFPEGMLTAVWQ